MESITIGKNTVTPITIVREMKEGDFFIQHDTGDGSRGLRMILEADNWSTEQMYDIHKQTGVYIARRDALCFFRKYTTVEASNELREKIFNLLDK